MAITSEFNHAMWLNAFRSIGKTFRGTIWENAARFKLVGKAYAALPREQDGHFDIRTARQLEGPLRALLDPNVRFVYIIGATQVLKSVAGDIWIPYILEHALQSILVLFETNDKAKVYCDARFMDTIKQHPVLSKLLAGVGRHDVNNTEIKIAGAKLLVGGLHDSNVSSLSWPIIWISEAWQHKSDGMLLKAIKRADRFPNTKKILIESQAGRVREDLHTHAMSAHQVPLTWACPFCGGRQTWEFSQLRPEDHPIESLRGKYAGLSMASGENLTIEERSRTAKWECYHCGEKIEHSREIRQRIMDTYEQDYKIPGPDGTRISPSAVCFYLPKESARDNSFEDSAKSYLIAKDAEREGNMVPLENWYMAERAVFYSPKLTQKTARVFISSSGLVDAIPNEVARLMMIDCQQDPDLSKQQNRSVIGHFWYVCWAVDVNCKNIYQISRGYATSFAELMGIRRMLKIPNKNVAIDGTKWTPEVIDAAALNWEEGIERPLRGKPFTAAMFWTVMRGNGTARSFRHEDGIYRVYGKVTPYERRLEIKGKLQKVFVSHIEWSNLSVKDQLFAIRQGGEGKPMLHILPREKLNDKTRLHEREENRTTYQHQISGEYRTRKSGRDYWQELHSNVHYNDCDCLGIVQLARGGLIGHIAAPEEAVMQI